MCDKIFVYMGLFFCFIILYSLWSLKFCVYNELVNVLYFEEGFLKMGKLFIGFNCKRFFIVKIEILVNGLL